tara:strand:- start:550 stop:1044 length:495 start_codon:yes stop_codon:yes gene_type:complete
MELTQVGGHFMGIYPCNNFFGHGFYQFSSELFYRVFCKANGFEIIDVVLFVDDMETEFYNVPDTSETHQRIQFINTKPVYIYVLAKRIELTNLFKNQPLQMDYAQIKWKGKRSNLKHLVKQKSLKQYIPQYFKNLLKALFNKANKPDNIHFKKPYFSVYNLKSN